MASFDTTKLVKDIKAGKITSKEPPKYIFERNPRNNRKVKKLNPRWTAWSKSQKKKQIKKDVDKYVKDRKGPINKDLTIDNSKKKKVVKKPETPKTETPKTETPKTEAPKTEAPKTETPKKKTRREKFNEKFIRTKGGKLAKRGTVGARRAENREAARKRAQAAAKLRIKKKKEKKS